MRKTKMIGALLLSIALVSGCSGNADLLHEKDRQIATLKSKVTSLELEISTWQEKYNRLEKTGKEALAERENVRERIQELETKLDRLTGRYSDAKKRADSLEVKLKSALAEFAKKEKLYLERIDNKNVVTVPNSIMFASGSSRLTGKARGILGSIIDAVKKDPEHEIRIEGHTDNRGIARRFRHRFRTNWELSLARALSVLHYLRKTHHVKPSRLAAIGYGEYRPVADNSTPEGRAANRRVVITIGPKLKGL